MSRSRGLTDDLVRLANGQHGLISSAQLDERLGRDAARSLRSMGVLVPVHRGVLRLAGAPQSFRQRAMAAALAYGPPVAVSHLAAGVLWQLPLQAAAIDVTLPPGRSGRRGAAVVHRLVLAPTDVTDRFAIPVTAPVRTLLDLADPKGAALSPELVTSLADELVRRRQLTAAALRRELVARSGHRAFPLLAHLAEGGDGPVPGSTWEEQVTRWLIEDGLPRPVLQHCVHLPSGIVLLDMAYPAWRVAVEFDGWQFHQGRGAFDRDRRRRNELLVAGWAVLVVTSNHSRSATVRGVRDVLVSRGWRPPG